MSAIKTKWSADTKAAEKDIQKLGKTILKLQEQLAKVTKESKKGTAEQKQLARAAKKVFDDTRTPAERYKQKLAELNRLVQKGAIDQDTYRRAAARAYTQMNAGSTQAVGSLSQIKTLVTGITAGIGGGFGLTMAVSKITQAFQVWLETVKELSAEARKASGEIVAFVALQEGGTKAERVRQVSGLATKYGITDRGLAYDTVQAMQSMLGDYRKGYGAAETIFRASQVGIPVELGRELEVLGISQKQAPGRMLRLAYAAGQASGRTPLALAKAAPAMAYYEDKTFGMALSGALAGAFPESQLPTYVKRAGMALSGVSKLAPWFEAQGLPKEATQSERLAALAAAGMGSAEKLTEAGLAEIREREAIMKAILLHTEIEKMQKEIQRRAKPGLLVGQRAAVEQELPWMAQTRMADQLDTYFKELALTGPKADPSREEANKQRLRASALRTLGIEQAMGIKLISEEGQASIASEVLAWVQGLAPHALAAARFGVPGAGPGDVSRLAGAVAEPPAAFELRKTMEDIRNLLEEQNEEIRAGNRRANDGAVQANLDVGSPAGAP